MSESWIQWKVVGMTDADIEAAKKIKSTCGHCNKELTGNLRESVFERCDRNDCIKYSCEC
jgi:hypothetical protein